MDIKAVADIYKAETVTVGNRIQKATGEKTRTYEPWQGTQLLKQVY